MGITLHVPAGDPAETRMRIRITRQTVAQGRVVRPGDELTVGEVEGRLLLGGRKAERLPDVAPPLTPTPSEPTSPISRRARQKEKS